MGYMGFGMRKEVYARKARRPFTALERYPRPRTGKTTEAGSLAPSENGNRPFNGIHWGPRSRLRWDGRRFMAIIVALVIGCLAVYMFVVVTTWILDPKHM
jgi:hypothetical protein